MGEILIWSARDSGPVIHFWFDVGGLHRRVCDGAPWEGPRDRGNIALPCRACKELYVEDVTCGRPVLALAASEFNPESGIATPENGSLPSEEGSLYAKYLDDAVCEVLRVKARWGRW